MPQQMGIVQQVIDFFTRLLRGRIDGATITAKSKMRNIEVKAKSAASKKFNQAVDGAMEKGKAKARPKAEESAEESAEEKVEEPAESPPPTD